MDGFEVRPAEPRTALLVFDDEAYAGLEVRCSLDVAMETYLNFLDIDSVTKVKALRELFTRWGDEVLVEWNAIDGGEPLPPDGSGMLRLGVQFAGSIIGAWLKGLSEPSGPLEEPSKNGVTSPAPSGKTAPRSRRRRRS